MRAPLRRLTTDPRLPLRQGAYASPLRDERVAAVLGAALGVLFSLCFVTGLYSHLQQRPQSWFPIPTSPAGLYRVTQGLHVASGIASVPVLVAKLWVVWPRFVAWRPVRDVGHLVERAGLVPLVAGGVFMAFSGVANIAQWYPWPFSFTATHFWMAWVTMGALLAHVGAKWATTRRSLARPSRRPALAEADPVLGASAEADATGLRGPNAATGLRGPNAATGLRGPNAATGLSRRGFLGVVAASSAGLTVVTAGQTVPALRPLALLAPRDPAQGPQGYPVNRGAVNAGVVDLARAPEYRLRVEGRVATPLAFDLDQLRSLPLSAAELPISCVEGWSYSAEWRGVRVRDLLDRAGADPDRTILVESLEPQGAYRTSTLNPGQAAAATTLLATHLDGEPLALDHGFPCRLIAPNRPGVLQTKWVARLVVL